MLERKARNVGGKEESSFLRDKPNATKVGESTDLGYNVDQHYHRSESYVDVIEPRYVCLDCGKKYKWQDSLRRHQRVDCGNKEKKFSCHLCDRRFKYRYELRNHLTAYHDL
ncbi:PREDICTED: zinc finger protein 283-like [Habropoda laboriosa]|uniref:zinc finger protein 283-like n=1 Tax=Habropoda laboriosa TaxID=597456 RepID=UPI00083D1872|nr:PREDICTED: zinc finger protein 283-like [Habropoda laboriosa]